MGGCGRHVLDLQGKHALCCMGSATTTGHNRVRDTIAMGLVMADAGTGTEPPELVPSGPNLRPADTLRASTVDGFLACDVGIASPEASGAGLDCVESMRARKLERCDERVLMEFEEENVRYTPLVLSCYGRRSSVLTSFSRAAARQAAGHAMDPRLSLWCGDVNSRWLLKSGDVRLRWCGGVCCGLERWVRTRFGELCWMMLTR